MSTSGLKLLFVDDDNAARSLIRNIFSAKGFEVLLATDGEDALSVLKAHHEDLTVILSDMRMPKMDGLELRRQILTHEAWKDIPFLIMSGHVSRDLAMQGIDLKITKFLDKATDHEEIVKIVVESCQSRALALEEKQILKASFVEEATGILEDLEPLLLHLESNPSDVETINTVFRLVHTIKGASGVLGLPMITQFLHFYEDLLTKVKNGQTKASPAIVTILLKSYDSMILIMAAVRSNTTDTLNFDELCRIFEVPKDSAVESHTHEAGDTPQNTQHAELGKKKESINVPTGMLDEFMALSGEITVIRNMVNKLVRSIERKIPSDKDVELLSDLLDEMHKINGSMQTRITDLRKTPIASVVRKLPRTVRDLARQLHKDVNLEIKGEDLRVDAAIGQVLSNSLIHMVRNSIDHGIEIPDRRVAAGKPALGLIQLSCREANDTVLVTIQDDGKGIDADNIRKKLLESGRLPPAEVERMSKRQIFQSIFESGFSTAEKVTDVSGRGVGMDMVRASVEGLRGRIDIESEPGKGTCFTIALPTPKSVVIISSLIVSAHDREFAIPQESIVRLMKLDEERKRRDLTTLEGGSVLRFEGKLLPLISLSQAFGIEGGIAAKSDILINSDDVNVVIVAADELVYGILVDKILDAEDIVVKTLHRCIEKLQAFMGATFMGDGSIGLIVDVSGLAKRCNLRPSADSRLSDRTEEESAAGKAAKERRELLLFGIDSPGLFGFPLERVHRFEEFPLADVKTVGEQSAVIYRDRLMALYDLQHALGLGQLSDEGLTDEKIKVIVVSIHDRAVGLRVKSIMDVVSLHDPIDTGLSDRPGIAGSIFVGDRAVAVVNIDRLLMDFGFVIEKAEEVAGAQVIPLIPEPAAAVATDTHMDAAAGGEGWGMF